MSSGHFETSRRREVLDGKLDLEIELELTDIGKFETFRRRKAN